MNLHALLRRRESDGKPLRVGLIGAGKFGSMYLSQVRRTPGVRLAAEVRSLKEGREAIEERARHELHMTRSDEILFQLVRPDGERAGAATAPSTARGK